MQENSNDGGFSEAWTDGPDGSMVRKSKPQPKPQRSVLNEAEEILKKTKDKYSETWTDGPDGSMVRNAESATPESRVLKEAQKTLAEKQFEEDFPEIASAFGPKVKKPEVKEVPVVVERKKHTISQFLHRIGAKIREIILRKPRAIADSSQKPVNK